MQSFPTVSVIVPVRNGENTIENLIKILLTQDYPKDKIQIIIVDNGSQDFTREIVKKYPVILENENRIKSSYAARNKGLSVAKGEIIAFTDADCIPEKNWISQGVFALEKQSADMAGGKISLTYSARKSAAEFVDAMTFMQNELYVENKRGAITANLFVRAELFFKNGYFPEVQSGGDIKWTGKAMQTGFSLIFTPHAIVRHPLRNFLELLKKTWRVGIGIGFFRSMREQKRYVQIIPLLLRLLIPVPQKNIRRALVERGKNQEMKNRRFAIWIISYICQLVLLAGMVFSIFQKHR
jgi:glycosyltransferase involved in cell wall biosynthesis